MAVGQGGFYTNNLTIAEGDQLSDDTLFAGDTQAPQGSPPQTLAFTAQQMQAGATAILAAAGATQGDAAEITSANTVVTVTASTQGVILPPCALGLKYTVVVPGTVGVNVYPNTGDQISTAATNAAVALAADKGNIYIGKDETTWAVVKGA